MQEEMCPSCIDHKRQTKLVLKQINFDCAVYLCPLKKCKYPKGHPWLVVKRSFDEYTETIRKLSQNKSEKSTPKTTLNDKDADEDLVSNEGSTNKDSQNDFDDIFSELNSINVEESSNYVNNDFGIGDLNMHELANIDKNCNQSDLDTNDDLESILNCLPSNQLTDEFDVKEFEQIIDELQI